MRISTNPKKKEIHKNYISIDEELIFHFVALKGFNIGTRFTIAPIRNINKYNPIILNH